MKLPLSRKHASTLNHYDGELAVELRTHHYNRRLLRVKAFVVLDDGRAILAVDAPIRAREIADLIDRAVMNT
jgi:hypothetical protein